MIQLRPFQEAMVAETRVALRSHDAVLFQLPTGGGKTVVAARMMSGAVAKGRRPWFACHRDFLVDQTSATLERWDVRHGFIAAGRRWDPYAPAQVCSIDTLRNRLDRVPPACRPTVLFVDEAKHCNAGSWAKVVQWAKDHGAKVVGLEATPERLDGRGLGEHFGAMVRGPSVAWLIEQGFLSKYEAYAPSIPDLSGVGSRGGDFKSDQLENAMDKDVLTGSIVGHYLKLARGKRAVCFAVSVKHSQHIVSALRSAGVSALHLDASSPSDERRAAARAMAAGEVDVLSNVSLFGEGYDLAAQAGTDVTIEAVILARPTQSLAMYMQQVGRALRQKPDAAIILDHAGNIVRHGLPDDDRDWSLEAKAKGKKKGEASAPAPRVCVECFGAFPAQSRACPHCGHAIVSEGKLLDETEAELVKVDPAELRRQRKMQEDAVKSLDELVSVGRARGYAKPEAWAAHLWTARSRRFEEQAAAQKRW